MLAKILLFTAVASSALLFILLHTTTPWSAGAGGILGAFVLAYLFAVSILSFCVYGLSRILVRSSRTVTVRKPLEALSLKQSYYYASVLGLAPVMVISMQSVGTLGVYEICLIMLLVLIGCVYVSKRTA